MAEQAAYEARVESIDRIFRELTWHGQKHALHTLARPQIGLTMPQMVTLLAIHDRVSCRMGVLADATEQSGGTLTGIVDRLIDEGLVERVRSANDRRVIEVTLTAEGQDRVSQVLEARYADMERILAHLDDEQSAQFEHLLGVFLLGVRGALPAEDARMHELEA
jgi:DNA-binding MarR family transcriptional regulator